MNPWDGYIPLRLAHRLFSWYLHVFTMFGVMCSSAGYISISRVGQTSKNKIWNVTRTCENHLQLRKAHQYVGILLEQFMLLPGLPKTTFAQCAMRDVQRTTNDESSFLKRTVEMGTYHWEGTGICKHPLDINGTVWNIHWFHMEYRGMYIHKLMIHKLLHMGGSNDLPSVQKYDDPEVDLVMFIPYLEIHTLTPSWHINLWAESLKSWGRYMGIWDFGWIFQTHMLHV